MTRRDLLEKVFRAGVTAAGFASAAVVLLILLFLARSSAGLFFEDGYPLGEFLTGRRWLPISDPPRFGLVPLAAGTLAVSIGALIIAVPFGVATATFLAEVAPTWLREILKPTVELLAAIPSVVIGFVGLAVVAPAVKEMFHLRTGLTAATPNEDEVEHLIGAPAQSAHELETAARRLRQELQLDALLVTRGSRGMMLLTKTTEPLHIPAVGAQAVDGTGAGDTVIATFALALASDSTFAEAAQLANYAGGLVVMKRGTATVTAAELEQSIDDLKP